MKIPVLLQEKTEGIVSPTSDFAFQVVSPILTSTSKLNGVNNYGDSDIVKGFCGEEGEGEVVIDKLTDSCIKKVPPMQKLLILMTDL